MASARRVAPCPTNRNVSWCHYSACNWWTTDQDSFTFSDCRLVRKHMVYAL